MDKAHKIKKLVYIGNEILGRSYISKQERVNSVSSVSDFIHPLIPA